MTQFANYLSPLSAAAGAKRSGCFVSAASPVLSSAAPERSRPFPTRSGLSPLTVGATIGRPSSSALPHCPHYQLKLHLRLRGAPATKQSSTAAPERSRPFPTRFGSSPLTAGATLRGPRYVSATPHRPNCQPSPPFRPLAASTSSRRRGLAVRPSYCSIFAKYATKKSPDGSLG